MSARPPEQSRVSAISAEQSVTAMTVLLSAESTMLHHSMDDSGVFADASEDNDEGPMISPIALSRRPSAKRSSLPFTKISAKPRMEGAPGEGMSFKDKRKFFEKEIAEHVSGSPKPREGRKFAYLQEHEVDKMKKEEETKAMSQEDFMKYMQETSGGDNMDYKGVLLASSPSNMSSVRTVKAERRLKDRSQSESSSPSRNGSHSRNSDGSHSRNSDGSHHRNSDGSSRRLSAEEREMQAEKRAEWRRARMKSLEADALRAHAVINKVHVHPEAHNAALNHCTTDPEAHNAALNHCTTDTEAHNAALNHCTTDTEALTAALNHTAVSAEGQLLTPVGQPDATQTGPTQSIAAANGHN